MHNFSFWSIRINFIAKEKGERDTTMNTSKHIQAQISPICVEKCDGLLNNGVGAWRSRETVCSS